MTRVHQLAGKTPAYFFRGILMKELSIFIDESGDFGEYSPHSPYYIISMVFHNQSIKIQKYIKELDYELLEIGLPRHCIHTGPIIRKEQDYRWMCRKERQKIFKTIMAFFRKIDVSCKSVCIDKKHSKSAVDVGNLLRKEIEKFLEENLDYFTSFDIVKIYYDNGQVEVSKTISLAFNTFLKNIEFRKVYPSDYKLFQVADLVCTLTLLEKKIGGSGLSKSERNFFKDERALRKNYLKTFNKKKM